MSKSMQNYYVTLATFKLYVNANISINIIDESIQNEALEKFNAFLNTENISQEIFQILNTIEISSLKKLLACLIFCNKKNLDEFSAIDLQQTHRPYVFKTPPPAYHKNIECEFLKRNFKNLEIPVEIQESDRLTQQRFIEFADQNKALFNEDPEMFKTFATTRFLLKNAFNDINYQNSNSSNLKNSLLSLIKLAIEEALQDQQIYKVKFAPYFKGKRNNNPAVAKWFRVHKEPLYKKIEEELILFSKNNIVLNEGFLKGLGLRACSACFNLN